MGKAFAAWVLAAATVAAAGTPQAVVQHAVSRVSAIVLDAELAWEPNAPKRRAEIRRVAEELFDFNEMARRALARHWAERSRLERDEFVRLFKDLLERSYMTTIENYAGEKIVYLGETIDGPFATVKTKIVTRRRAEIPIEYRLYQTGPRWAVYDVVLEGVSFVSTYRSQFDRVIQTTSFSRLIERLRQKDIDIVAVQRGARKP
jgi:phospholipid transport system substrate-binding protein